MTVGAQFACLAARDLGPEDGTAALAGQDGHIALDRDLAVESPSAAAAVAVVDEELVVVGRTVGEA